MEEYQEISRDKCLALKKLSDIINDLYSWNYSPGEFDGMSYYVALAHKRHNFTNYDEQRYELLNYSCHCVCECTCSYMEEVHDKLKWAANDLNIEENKG